VAADGRHSTLRQVLGWVPRELGAPMDVLWFRLPRHDTDVDGLDMHVNRGGILLLIDRGDYWQVALVIRKGGYDAVVAAGLDAFRKTVTSHAPMLAGRTDAIRSWDDVHVLSVSLNRLQQWHAPGVLLIGDAAHAMSPIGGVGINLAVQDAIATANIITGPLKAGSLGTAHLAAVARRRRWPTTVIQTVQRIAQRQFVEEVLDGSGGVRAPAALRLLQKIPQLQYFPARLVGVGVRPELPAVDQ
jgi:2-polyprenyl-6-methoxyphenol hydroxylase-like FAD-dependent oxidoreductase